MNEIGGPPEGRDIFEVSKPVVDYILSLGWGDKSRWEKESDKTNNEAHSDSVVRGLRRPYVSEPRDIERVDIYEQKFDRGMSPEDEKRQRFSIAFEKTLVLLANMDNVKFLGEEIDLCLSSRYDDYFNGADIIGKINNENGGILFSIDVTTSFSEDSLDSKRRSRAQGKGQELKYLPAQFKKRERTFSPKEDGQMAINVMVGFEPKNAFNLMILAIKALNFDKKRESGNLKPEQIEEYEKDIKTTPARIHLMDQIMQQAQLQIGYVQGAESNEEVMRQIKEIREQIQGDGSRHSDALTKDRVCRFVERNN